MSTPQKSFTNNLPKENIDRRRGNQEPLYIFLHMPKCAGTTLRVHIENNFSKDEALPLYVDIDERFRDRDFVKEYVASLPDEKKQTLKIIYGHEVHYGIHKLFNRDGRYFTFLRHPLPRTISWYNFRRQKNWVDKKIIDKFISNGITPDLKKWLLNSPWVWNEMTGYFADFGYCEKKDHYSDSELDQILDHFFFVGLTETFDDDALFLYSLLGIKNTFFKPQNISKKYFNPEEKEMIESLVTAKNQYDLAIYEKALHRHNQITRSDRYQNKVKRMRFQRTISPVLEKINKFIGRV